MSAHELIVRLFVLRFGPQLFEADDLEDLDTANDLHCHRTEDGLKVFLGDSFLADEGNHARDV